MRLSIYILLFSLGCTSKDKVDNDLSSDSLTPVIYERLPEPPPLKIDTVKTDSSEIRTRYDEELDFIREFNELDSFEITYYKDFSYRTKKVRESGVMVDGYEKGVWYYYDSTGKLTNTKDFGPWDKKMHVR